MANRPFDSSLCCSECGKVLEDSYFSEEPTFIKGGAGQSHLSGNFVRSDCSASRERTLDSGIGRLRVKGPLISAFLLSFRHVFEGMKNLCCGLGMDQQPEGILKAALAFYRMAFQNNFIREHRSELVQAACVYIACRENRLPYLFIDFSNWLKVNVYVLVAVFVQLCKALWLEEHCIIQKPFDPSLFIHKYTTWRRGSGLWGAAVYLSALAYGLKCSKSDVVSSNFVLVHRRKLVHVREATLTKRLVEFENAKSAISWHFTDNCILRSVTCCFRIYGELKRHYASNRSGAQSPIISYWIEELNANAKADETGSATETNIGLDISDSRELLCEQKGTNTPGYKIGLCKSCYNELVEFSGSLEGGSDPPAFQRAERERATLTAMEKENESSLLEKERNSFPGVEKEKSQTDTRKTVHPSSTDGGLDGSHREDNMTTNAGDESDSLSDIDDVEVDGYLHNEEEKNYKKIIWEKMNREYLEEQAAKEAAAAAAREACATNFKGTPEELQAAQELATATAAALAKAKKEKKQIRAAEEKNATPAQAAAEATRQMLIKKRLSSKINYDVLDKLFDETGAPESTKKQKTESNNSDEDMPRKGGRALESEKADRTDEPEGEGEDYEMEGYAEGEEYGNDQYYGNDYLKQDTITRVTTMAMIVFDPDVSPDSFGAIFFDRT
ncbi:transcription factor IIIB 60 kDa subunit-like [Punica granatum]|uniref:Transcription factor IIIB 60 kDa subunit-like n=1 Tax=Punica granatum TaxID=22663 RepID=A0A6P8DDA7_PUNGR|nr:transcription factor IIIB 60 kDa subunit-like [Punica granatum]